MPGLDKTGPEGQGSKTGRGLGKCNPKNTEETPEVLRRGRRGQGRGRKLNKEN